MAKVNPGFLDKVKELGAFDISACYSCGNCTAICPLSTEEYSFPRMMIRYSMLGLEDKILSGPELWRCYYCGECTDTCPRQADPGGLMMALRRYAIRRYSLGKIADLFYNGTSAAVTWLVLTVAAIAGIAYFHNPNPNLTRVDPLSFITLDFLHYAGTVLGVVIAFFAIVQLVVMWRSLHKDGIQASLGEWLQSFWDILINEVFIQKTFDECEDKNRYWAHLALLWGFLGLLLATALAFGIDFLISVDSGLKIVPHVIGIVSGLVLLYGSGYYLYRRYFIKDSYSKYSHHSDWVFVWLMFLAGLTGFLLDVFMWVNLPWPAYITFAVHLVIVFDLLLTAPFTKFAHAVYRPLALWMSETYSRKEKEQQAQA